MPELVDDGLTKELLGYRDAIRRHILGMVRDASDAEDLTQEVFLRAFRKLPTLGDRAKVRPWLYRIATNVCLDRFRQTSSRPDTESLNVAEGPEAEGRSEPAVAGPTRLDVIAEQSEMSACVRENLALLPRSYRETIELHDLEGLTDWEIAERLGVTLATAKIRLHRARKRLKELLHNACTFSYDDRAVFVCDRKTPSGR